MDSKTSEIKTFSSDEHEEWIQSTGYSTSYSPWDLPVFGVVMRATNTPCLSYPALWGDPNTKLSCLHVCKSACKSAMKLKGTAAFSTLSPPSNMDLSPIGTPVKKYGGIRLTEKSEAGIYQIEMSLSWSPYHLCNQKRNNKNYVVYCSKNFNFHTWYLRKSRN